jgi:hypothetical protein
VTDFYDLFRDAQRALEIVPLRDLYSTKDTYVSLALTNGVSLTSLSEHTGVALTTPLKHYSRFVHSSATDAIELAKIEPEKALAGPKRESLDITLDIGRPSTQKMSDFPR